MKIKELAFLSYQAKALVTDHEGENMRDHCGAATWNVAAIVEALEQDPIEFCRAISQEPLPLVEPGKAAA